MNDLECHLKVFGFTFRILGGPVKGFKQESDKSKCDFQNSYSGNAIKEGLDGGETVGMEI